MDVKVLIPKFAQDMDIEWTDRELVFMALMLEIGWHEGWETRYFMHTHDYSKILGCYPLKADETFKRLSKVFQIAQLNTFTIAIQGVNPGRRWGGKVVKSQPIQLEDPTAIAMWYYLCGAMLHGIDNLLSDPERVIPYTHRTQGQTENHNRLLILQSSILDNASERE